MTKTKIAAGIALLGGVVLTIGPLALGLYGLGINFVQLLGLAGIVMALKTLYRPQPVDSWILVGIGALAILVGLAAGVWINLIGGAAILGAGVMRRIYSEPEGGPHVTSS